MKLSEKIMHLLNKNPVDYSTVAIKKICGGNLSKTSASSSLLEQLHRLRKAKKVFVTKMEWNGRNKTAWWKSTKWIERPGGVMRLAEAKDMLTMGVPFGDVYPLLSQDDQESIRYWFTRVENLPNLVMRVQPAGATTGNACRKCGGNLVRTGTCETCQDCGENEGCG